MHLLRVQVPDFRGLKNIDITFEKDFSPSIFPLGSQNGGGKSTLLQLIFVLLHCSVDEDKKQFLQNMLEGFKICDGQEKRVLAIVDIWDGEKIVKIDFFSYNNDFSLKQILALESKKSNIDEDYFDFSVPTYSTQLKSVKNKISNLEAQKNNLVKILRRLDMITEIEDNEERRQRIKREIINIQQLGLIAGFPELVSVMRPSEILSIKDVKQLQHQITQRLESSEINLRRYHKECKIIEEIWKKSIEYLQSENMRHICNYSIDRSSNDKRYEALLCHLNNIDSTEIENFLTQISYKIFLAAPSTQIFLFLPPDSRKLLFRNSSNGNRNYYGILEAARSELPGLFTYDFLAVELLIESFKDARDRDFREAIKTGSYGNSYQSLINDLNLLLGNKRINLNEDFSGVNFQLDNNGETIELYPEDLSHGELKRLSIYIWLKSRNIKDAIVLMDEVEIAFHPDWQYQIISDLKEWAPSNQYILATHSYALCEALTPAHVKEIEPKLIKSESNITNES
ncbi:MULTISPECIES: AAA family ATPase [unclassified Microcoleus]|uniref:ATP-binding protein n=1 Tax=unclassified Microcoleus TaxID=2642155 RepID=UPI0025DC38C3|nr:MULTISPECIES: AAA family ATPase [unclassified Microcoleus]